MTASEHYQSALLLLDEYRDADPAFPEGKMTAEAAAFMYLTVGVEEIR